MSPSRPAPAGSGHVPCPQGCVGTWPAPLPSVDPSRSHGRGPAAPRAAQPHRFASSTASESRSVQAWRGSALQQLRSRPCCRGAAQQVELSARRSRALLQSHLWTCTPSGDTASQWAGGRGTMVQGDAAALWQHSRSAWHGGMLKQRRCCVDVSHQGSAKIED